jgi:hypothetical protein
VAPKTGRNCKVEGFSLMGDSVVLVCAVLASLTSGVLVAYGVCLAMFGLLRIHARQVVEKHQMGVQVTASIVEG